MIKMMTLATASILSLACLAQDKTETIEGNGKLVTRNVPVSSFESLKASGVYELKLTQGDKEAVRIEADENLQDLFQVRNEGSKLVIDMKDTKNKNLKMKNKVRVFVTFRKLKDMDLSMVGNMSSENQLAFDDLKISNQSVGNMDMKLTARKLDLSNKSVGKVTLSGKADQAVVVNEGVGNLEAGNFVVQTMEIDNSGVGHSEVNAEKDLKISDSFLGKVRNRGAAAVKKNKRVRA